MIGYWSARPARSYARVNEVAEARHPSCSPHELVEGHGRRAHSSRIRGRRLSTGIILAGCSRVSRPGSALPSIRTLRSAMADRFALEYPLLHWLLTDARRITEPKAFLAALAEQLIAHGIEVSRLDHRRADPASAGLFVQRPVGTRPRRVRAVLPPHRRILAGCWRTARSRRSIAAADRCAATRRRRRVRASSASSPISAARA